MGALGWRARSRDGVALAALVVVQVVLVVGTVSVPPVAAAAAQPAPAPPAHTVTVSGAGVATYPDFDPAVARYGITTTSATGGTVTVAATTTDPAGVVTIDGTPAPGGTRTVTGLTAGDEVAVFITDASGTSRHSYVYLPPRFPALERTTPDPAPGALAPGLVLLTLGLWVTPSPYFETAVDLNGVPAFVQQRPNAMDLQRQPNGRYSVFEPTTAAGRTGSDLVELDSQWREVARHRTVGLVDTDGHDGIVLPDGTVWLMAYEPNTGTGLTDAVIQELRPDGTLGFSWTSAPYAGETVTAGKADYAHVNSLQLLPDGDVLASFRHLSSVYRIATHPHDGFAVGDVVWKLGGRDSDFAFPTAGDTGPCAQHTARMLPNGHVLMFDNGSWDTFGTTVPMCIDQADPGGPLVQRLQTRVVEYALDTAAHTATVVQSYEPAGRFAVFAGSAQRLGNGNTEIGWAAETTALASETAPDGTLLWELRDPGPSPRWFTYRAHKTVVPDAIAPAVAVAVPADGATYVEGATLAPSYSCTDRGGSSLQSCTASPVDTASPGVRTFTATGTDGAGGTTTVTRHYTVVPASQPSITATRSKGPGRRLLAVRLTNDGARPDTLAWSTRGGGRWRLQGKRSGTTPLLQPGESWTFRLKARPPQRGRLRAKVVIGVASTSSGRTASYTWRLKARGASS